MSKWGEESHLAQIFEGNPETFSEATLKIRGLCGKFRDRYSPCKSYNLNKQLSQYSRGRRKYYISTRMLYKGYHNNINQGSALSQYPRLLRAFMCVQ